MLLTFLICMLKSDMAALMPELIFTQTEEEEEKKLNLPACTVLFCCLCLREPPGPNRAKQIKEVFPRSLFSL